MKIGWKSLPGYNDTACCRASEQGSKQFFELSFLWKISIKVPGITVCRFHFFARATKAKVWKCRQKIDYSTAELSHNLKYGAQ